MSVDTELIKEILLDYAFALREGELEEAGRYLPEAVEDEAFALTKEIKELRRYERICSTCRDIVGETLARKCPASD